MRKPRILVVGSISVDMTAVTGVFPASGETVLGKGFSSATGGKGSNQAVQAALLGADVTMIAKVGKDAFAKEVLASTAAAGVKTEHFLQDDSGAPTGVAIILLEEDEQGNRKNRIIVLSGANMTLTVEDVAFLKESIAEYDLVMLQFEIPMAVNTAVAQWAKAKGVPVMVNPAPATPMPEELLQCTTYLSPNEHEAAALSGVPIRVTPELNLADVQEAAEALRRKGVENVLITLGENGAALMDGQGLHVMPSVPHVAVADPTAAGDSFVGTFCVGLCAGLTKRQAMDFARNAAAITVSRVGAQPSLPTLQEVMAALKEHGESDFPTDMMINCGK